MKDSWKEAERELMMEKMLNWLSALQSVDMSDELMELMWDDWLEDAMEGRMD
jgi:hypothetical protein